MVLFSKDHTYKHDWGAVTLAFWRKYPNRHAKHVKAVDTYASSLCPRTGDMVTRRVIICHNYLPSWIVALGVSPVQYAVEQTVTNARNKTMVVRSRNVSGASVMVVEETCSYSAHPDRKDWTRYHQEAHIRAFLPFVYGRLERYSFDNFHKNSSKGLEIIEDLCEKFARQRVVQDGLSSRNIDVPQWLLSLAKL